MDSSPVQLSGNSVISTKIRETLPIPTIHNPGCTHCKALSSPGDKPHLPNTVIKSPLNWMASWGEPFSCTKTYPPTFKKQKPVWQLPLKPGCHPEEMNHNHPKEEPPTLPASPWRGDSAVGGTGDTHATQVPLLTCHFWHGGTI